MGADADSGANEDLDGDNGAESNSSEADGVGVGGSEAIVGTVEDAEGVSEVGKGEHGGAFSAGNGDGDG